MRRHFLLHVLVVLLAGCALPPLLSVDSIAIFDAATGASGCDRDTDCKGARLCVDRACVDPPDAAAAPAPIDLQEAPVDLAVEPADLAAPRDLTPIVDLLAPPDLVCGWSKTPCCPGEKCLAPMRCSLGQCVQCGHFMEGCCDVLGVRTCDGDYRCLRSGDVCGMQNEWRCIAPLNCGGAGAPCCDLLGKPAMLGGGFCVGPRFGDTERRCSMGKCVPCPIMP